MISLFPAADSVDGISGPRRLFVTDTVIADLPAVQPFVNEFKDGRRGGDLLLILGAGEKYT